MSPYMSIYTWYAIYMEYREMMSEISGTYALARMHMTGMYAHALLLWLMQYT